MSRAWLGWLYGVLGVAIFATSLPISRIAVVDLHPGVVGTGRAAIAGLLSALLLLLVDRRLPSRREVRLLIAGGAGIVLGFPFLTALAMQTLPANHGGVLLGLLPLATAAMAMLVAGERPQGWFWLFAALGSALVIAFSLLEGGGGFERAHLWLVLAVLAASFGYAISGWSHARAPVGG